MHVVITGGSSGIGLEIARIYARNRASVTILARDRQRLNVAQAALLSEPGAAKEKLQVLSADVTCRENLSQAIRAATELQGPCDVLVAAAGEVEPALFEHMPSEVFDRQIVTNITGTVNAVRACYESMLERGEGKIMIIASAAAMIGIPGYTAYCASKTALTGFAEALAAEAKGRGIDVMISYPPDTLTPQLERERLQRPKEASLLIGQSVEVAAYDVARKIVRAIDRCNPKLIFGTRLGFLYMFGPMIKPTVYRWFHWRLQRLGSKTVMPAAEAAVQNGTNTKTSGAIGGGTS
mgnify:CR=1 FL=1